MRTLGIDPGLRLTGYGCVDLADGSIEPTLVEGGVLQFSAKDSLEDRLVEMYQSLTELIAELRPQRVAVEKLFAHYKHPNTAILMGHARGVILLAARQAGLDIDHLPSTEVKKSVTGDGHATKEKMQLAVQTQCRLAEPPHPADVADAIAIALTSARRFAYARLNEAKS